MATRLTLRTFKHKKRKVTIKSAYALLHPSFTCNCLTVDYVYTWCKHNSKTSKNKQTNSPFWALFALELEQVSVEQPRMFSFFLYQVFAGPKVWQESQNLFFFFFFLYYWIIWQLLQFWFSQMEMKLSFCFCHLQNWASLHAWQFHLIMVKCTL